MISAITGQLKRVDDDRVHLTCGNLDFEILVPAFDIDHLRANLNEEITFHTIFDLEGDATRGGLTPRLIGFLRADDKRFFQLFITVKGIGPKRALRALVKSVGTIAEAIESKNAKALKELPEIGNRTAETIVAELAGKMAQFAMSGSGRAKAAAHTTGDMDAIDGAMVLGITRFEAERLLERARQTSSPKTTEDLLREMLRLRGVRDSRT